MKVCSKCVLPESTPKIYFDENGVCNFCHSFKKPHYKGETALLKILESEKNKKNKVTIQLISDDQTGRSKYQKIINNDRWQSTGQSYWNYAGPIRKP